MNFPVRRFAVVAAALASALGTVVPSASAATADPWTVTPAGAYTAHAVQPTWTVPSATFLCDSLDVTAGMLQATGATGGRIGTIDAIAVRYCSVGGIEYTVTQSATPWTINPVGQNPTHTNWVDVRISGVSVHWNGFGCAADFKGALYGHYENDTGNLVIGDRPGALLVSNVNCLGLINNGDAVTLRASLHMAMASTGEAPLIKAS